MKLSNRQVTDAYETYLVAYNRCAGNLPTETEKAVEHKYAAALAAGDHKTNVLRTGADFEKNLRWVFDAPAPVKAAKPDVAPQPS